MNRDGEAEVLLWKGKYRRLLESVEMLTFEVGEDALTWEQLRQRLVRILGDRGVQEPEGAGGWCAVNIIDGMEFYPCNKQRPCPVHDLGVTMDAIRE